MLDRSSLVTPRRHGELLIVPDPADQRAALHAAPPTGDLLGRPLAEVRAALRRRLDWPDPVVVTGHQAEFVHAGVFVKSLAAARAVASGGTSVYLTVDSDTPKTVALPVPVVRNGRVEIAPHPFPDFDGTRPLEVQTPLDADRWAGWFADVRGHLPGARDWFDLYLAGWQQVSSGQPLPAAFRAAQRTCEAALGIEHVHLAVSEMSDWPEFRAFAAHIAQRAEAFAGHYNAAQQAYRARHRVRTAQRPVPPLAVAEARTEVPFWLIRADGVRHRMFVGRGPDRRCYADEQFIGMLPPPEWDAAGSAWPWLADGWRLRPRALTLSGFCRLVVGDLFIHGIGGAKYDELTDDFTHAFWGTNPAPLACVSAALLLDLPHEPNAAAHLNAARYRARDVRFNPQRQLQGPDPELVARRAAAVEAGRHLATQHPDDHRARRARYQEIQRATEALRAAHADEVARIEAAVEREQREVTLTARARNREYFHGLFDRATIDDLHAAVRTAYSSD